MPPAIWKNPTPLPPLLARYHSVRKIIVSMPPLTVEAFSSPLMTYDVKMLPIVLSSHPGTMIGMFFSQAASIQLFFGSIS